jgi:hypothetical protein
MIEPSPAFVRLYRAALLVYPSRLRREYREQMLLTLTDAYRDGQAGKLRFWIHMYADLVKSSLMERLYMVRDIAWQRPLIYHTLVLAVILSFLGGAAAFVIDQMMRSGANQPQIDMVNWYAGEIRAGEAPDNVIPPGYVDLENSLQPFVIFYDDQGRPGPGTGYLDQALPVPPPGVFAFVRGHGSEKVTWQPRPGVRLASVIQRINGKTPGFVLAGRSLRLVEEEKSILWWMALGVWLTMMLLLIGGASLVRRAQRAGQSQPQT